MKLRLLLAALLLAQPGSASAQQGIQWNAFCYSREYTSRTLYLSRVFVTPQNDHNSRPVQELKSEPKWRDYLAKERGVNLDNSSTSCTAFNEQRDRTEEALGWERRSAKQQDLTVVDVEWPRI